MVSAAEGNDQDSENFGKVDEVKQYPFRKKVFLTDHFVLLLFVCFAQ